MRYDAYSEDAQREPDIVVFGRPEPAQSGQADGGPAERLRRPVVFPRRLRRFVEPGLVVAGAVVMLLAGYATGSRDSPVISPAAPPPVSGDAAPAGSLLAAVSRPWLIAPRAASAGEMITVLAHRNRLLCGAAELRFDGGPVVQRPNGYVGPADSGREDVFVLMTVPLSATAGRHAVELYGPIQGGRGNSACADVPEHQGRLATTTVVVRPSRR
jgi:hypothetical protein